MLQDELADQTYVMRILEETRKVWNRMKDLKDSTVLMTHDGEHKHIHVTHIYTHMYVCILDLIFKYSVLQTDSAAREGGRVRGCKKCKSKFGWMFSRMLHVD